MKLIFARLLIVAMVAALGGLTVAAHAEDLGAVKSRMSQRISKIDQLKSAGAIGEDNRGYLAVRGGGDGADSVVAEENRDRSTVYAEIGRQTGASADQVGRKRAQQIAAGSAPGVWLQKDDGSWYRK